METLVLFTPETEKAIKAFMQDKEKQALISSPEAKAAYRKGCLRVRRMAYERRLANAVDPLLCLEKITI